MTLDEPPEPTPPARLLGWVWVVVGGVAVVVGLVTTVFMIVVFGLVAVALGLVLHGVANVRDKSRARTARTLSGDPPPPATAPSRPMPEPFPDDEPEPGDESEPDDERRPDGGDDDEDDGGHDGNADDDEGRAASGSSEGGAGTDSHEGDRPVPAEDVSISDVEDGDGNPISEQDRPGRRPGVVDEDRDRRGSEGA